MSFRFAARALLELGKELISSDEVALYELIKNAYDAKSPQVEIVARVVLPYSAYSVALEELEEGRAPADITKDVMGALDPTITAQEREELERRLGRLDWEPDRYACALRAAYRRMNWIEIRDTGHGMRLEELREVFLTVGTRSRRQDNIVGKQYLGDKGVGRLSAMRLGDQLRVETSRSGDKRTSKLRIDWSRFSHDSDAPIESIRIEPTRGSLKADPESRGTTIRISALSADWSVERFRDMFEGKIARMIDPFEPGRANKFLKPRYNDVPVLVPSVPRALLGCGLISQQAKFGWRRA